MQHAGAVHSGIQEYYRIDQYQIRIHTSTVHSSTHLNSVIIIIIIKRRSGINPIPPTVIDRD